MRVVRLLRPALRTSDVLAPLTRSRRVRVGALTLAAAASVAVPATVVATAATASAETATTTTTPTTPAVASVALLAPATVTKGRTVQLTAHLTLGPVSLPGRTVQFVARPAGGASWASLQSARTNQQGVATITTPTVTAPTEFGAYYSDLAGAVHSQTASAIVHTIDLAASKPTTVAVGTAVNVAGHLLKDRSGIPSQTVKVWLKPYGAKLWSSPLTLRTNTSGVAVLSRAFTRTTQVGIRFLGASNLAPSPLGITTITVKATTMTTSGFVFPFENRRIAQPVSAWSQDQGVDLAANGYACGANAILVAVGDGVVIQEGISGFGPTAPVLRMTSGPFKGRNVYYGHTGHVYVPVGAHVRAGQRLAQIGCGRVGMSSAPHLEIGVGVAGGPPCCPSMHQTSAAMLKQLVAALRA